ncbi:hypothetical protein ABH19_01525 [Leptospirillum sp. Group II 'CF-1']|jgi:hypothetical protein|uniref:Uncharacterized protein n=1 Tax=Leptospirillum sp. Group II '5-way CG' TaxID=419541 RepID=B6AM56_9BACT|nr:hypothetical protein [Leptospirillum sp. Group II 'CF-1']AKS22713.1 hypothetical protein ABH19_01525 [Leptospirillum sp. Group II 'CF-1']EDZ39563.1 MAG: Hypothetical protein CGL2_11277197 [Leptospirillum sp. Group II '5-way CG']
MKKNGEGFKATGGIILTEWTEFMADWTKKGRIGQRGQAKRHSFVLLDQFLGRIGIEEASFTTICDSDRVEKGGEKPKNII